MGLISTVLSPLCSRLPLLHAMTSHPRPLAWCKVPQKAREDKKPRAQETLPKIGEHGPEGEPTHLCCVCGQPTYFHQHKAQQDRGSHTSLSPGGDRTHGDKTGTVLGSCRCTSHIPYGSVGSVLLLCPQSSPRGTRSHTSCGSKDR